MYLIQFPCTAISVSAATYVLVAASTARSNESKEILYASISAFQPYISGCRILLDSYKDTAILRYVFYEIDCYLYC